MRSTWFQDSSTFLNSLEKVRKSVKTQLAREIEIAFIKKIGKTTYEVCVPFSTETINNKIKRMLRNEIHQM